MLFQFSFCYIYRERDLGTFYIPSHCFNFNFGLLVNAYFNFTYCITHHNNKKRTNEFGSLLRRLFNWLIDGAFLVHGKT